MGDVEALLDAVEHDVATVLDAGAGRSRANALALTDVRAPVQRALQALGPVAVWTGDSLGDISCVHEVEPPGTGPRRCSSPRSCPTPRCARARGSG